MANEKRIFGLEDWKSGGEGFEDVDECCCDEDGLHAGEDQLLISRRMWSSLFPAQFPALYPSIMMLRYHDHFARHCTVNPTW